MKKTITANISGIVFHIDEDAYEKLSRYLANVRSHFSTEEGGDEILNDIEGRIAEMLQAKLTANKKVITLDDVQDVVRQLGEPEQIGGADEPEPHTRTRNERRSYQRLYRDTDDKMIAGVSSGLAYYFNVEPVWVRVLFIIFTFLGGFGPLVYIVLWIVVPRAHTTAEKLEMRGEKVNLSNIEKSIREELNELKEDIIDFSKETKEKLKKKEKRTKTNDELSDIAAGILTVFLKIVGVLLVIASLTLLLILVSAFFWTPIPIRNFDFSISDFLSTFLTNPSYVKIAIIGILLVVGIPVFLILVAGVKLLFGIEGKIRYLGGLTFFLWMVGLSIVVFMSIEVARSFSNHYYTTQEYTFEFSHHNQIYINTNTNREINSYRRRFDSHRPHSTSFQTFLLNTQGQSAGIPRVIFRSTEEDQPWVNIRKESRGWDYLDAQRKTDNIQYGFTQKDSLLVLDTYFFFDEQDGYRNQKVTIEVYVPKDKNVVASRHVKNALEMSWNRGVKMLER